MKIESIKFQGFQASNRHAAVEFSDHNVTIIYGANGCGKTTFLKAINAFLSQDNELLSVLGIQSIEIKILENNESKSFIVKKIEDGYDWSHFEKSGLVNSKSLSLGVERGISTQSLKIDPEAIFEFFRHTKNRKHLFPNLNSYSAERNELRLLSEELSYFLKRRNAVIKRHKNSGIDFNKNHLYLQTIKIENIEELLLRRYKIARLKAAKRIQSALFDTLSVAIELDNQPVLQNEITVDNLKYRLIESKERIIEALDDGEENLFKTRIIDILNKIDKEEELKKVLDHPILSQLFVNMIHELEFEKLILSSINLLVERFNAYLINGKNLIVNSNEVYVEIEGDRHSVNDLSSGERHILTFLTLVLFEGQERNFLIIDEPEISLNIKWQRELMTIFSNLLPDTQIIVASHSPALAKRNPDYLSELKVWRT